MDAPLPQIVARMDADRLRRYRDNLDFYHGRQWPGSPRRRERRLTFNYARAIVEKVTSYLMTGLDFAVDPVDDTTESRALAARTEAGLRRVWEDNQLDQLDFDTELDAAILGDAAYKVTWEATPPPTPPRSGDGSPIPLTSPRSGARSSSSPSPFRGGGQGGGVGAVRITAPDVQGLFAWWRGDDPSRVWRVASRYQLSPDEVREVFGVAPVTAAGERLSNVIESWTDTELEIWLDDRLLERRANPYSFIPYVIYANLREAKSFWGVSDIAAIMEPARELNRALSQLSAILELSGNPIAVLENVSESEDIAVTPGAVWEIPADARAYLLDLLQGGGVRLHTEYVDLVYHTLHDLGESPRTAFGENRLGLSGVALNTELDPLLKKVQRKRLIRGAAYRRRNEMILRLLEQFTGEPFAPYRSRIVWGAVLPQDRSRQVDDEIKLVGAGIHSRRRAADALGVEDPDAEFTRWLDEEARSRGTNLA